MILITGATGNLGATVIDYLLTKVAPTEIAAFVRSEEKAATLKAKGIDVRIGNFDDVHSLEKAMNGIDNVLLVSSPDHGKLLQQHKNVVDAAKKADVKHLAYTGIALKDASASTLKLMLEAHFQTEDYIKASNVPYTILRNTLYADAIPIFIGDKAFELGIYLPAENAKVPFVLHRELGEAAGNVLLQPGHENKTYTLTASKFYTYTDVANILTQLTGKTVTYYLNADVKTFEGELRKVGVPDPAIAAISGFIADKRSGQYEILNNDLEKLLGRRPLALRESLKEIYSL
ncbi:NmrA family transcriptional regulator [Pedobacter kyungheensis]|uniref:NmrA family transcriptional regulator n=1 Tax=Pedobacter kyungheensis TaxID=1069985 RepID=A0A0C1D591_9SPHI|nr:SDR family oxidoreductase [Pedobacter kyungheensis]KIA88940.1 NmrA family transcriptional regulator [Pedobacter kyungheensis]